ncbi:MAG TPA: RuBisCO large subunit C-terminal-like domain-containing protein [Thermomonas sp.]|nr:RuBisCO large subunit C-terminal-like domain-containing protein [Thermomonas sp.]
MSSALRLLIDHPRLFHWDDGLDRADYIEARYTVGSHLDGEATAVAMAMEQSAAITAIRGYVAPDALMRESTVRVLSVEAVAGSAASDIAACEGDPAQLDPARARLWRIVLAIPLRLLPAKPTQLLNGAVGDLPRYGFITRFRLDALALPDRGFGPGPGFGVAGLRERFGVPRGPLLCRPQRPAVGIDIATMAGLNHDALLGGCHLVKDCELQAFADDEAFATHVRAMVASRDAAADRAGERKGYIANLICEPDELAPRLQVARDAGVDGVLLAPMLQGLGVLAWVAKQGGLPILAHPSVSELITRHPGWGIAPALLNTIFERYGADIVIAPGGYGDDGRPGEWPPHGATAPARALPLLQGGKQPAGLPGYRSAVGSDDFLLNVASWLDVHPAGIEAAAREFRAAIDARPPA